MGDPNSAPEALSGQLSPNGTRLLTQLLAKAIAGQALRQASAEPSNFASAEPQEACSGHRGG